LRFSASAQLSSGSWFGSQRGFRSGQSSPPGDKETNGQKKHTRLLAVEIQREAEGARREGRKSGSLEQQKGKCYNITHCVFFKPADFQEHTLRRNKDGSALESESERGREHVFGLFIETFT